MRRRILLSGNGSEIDYSTQYLTFTALESGTFSLMVPASITSTEITGGVSYSTDDGATWTTTAITSSAQTITTPTVNAGGKVLWKAVANRYGTGVTKYCTFGATGNFEVSGNIMSLLYGDDFASKTTYPATYTFVHLFSSSRVVNAKNLILPATATKGRCYYEMFSGCTRMITAPKLPAKTLSTYCYAGMFYNTAITEAPELPATTLATYCYYRMFRKTGLTKSPVLPAKTLTDSCYYQMFYGCSNLTHVTMLATNISASNCLYNWLSSVAATGTLVKDASMTTLPSGASGIPSGWTTEDA